MAIAAYSGIRALLFMESCTNNKSLIIGKLRMEESRKEISSSPGAPSVPANSTILSFQVFSGNPMPLPQIRSLARRLSRRESQQCFDRFLNHIVDAVQLLR